MSFSSASQQLWLFQLIIMLITSATPSYNLNHGVLSAALSLMLSHTYSPQLLWSFLMQLVSLPVYDEGLKCLKKGVESIYLFLEGCNAKWITLHLLSCRHLVKVYASNLIWDFLQLDVERRMTREIWAKYAQTTEYLLNFKAAHRSSVKGSEIMSSVQHCRL